MIRWADQDGAAEEEQSLWEWFFNFWGEALFVVMVVLISAAIHIIGARVIKRSVRKWISSGRSREDSMADTPEATVELQSMMMSQRREQRAVAVGQLLQSALGITIWGTSTLLILTQLGINVAPLIASAGVVGVALGFGAQTLIKDYLSGFFMIVEDQYGVGDLVDVGAVIGTVEEVALRVTRIRDPNGVVWYVRNGEILRVANQSQGWTMASATLPVSYDADLEEVRRVVVEVGNDMYNDPETRERMLGRPMFAGVEAVSGEAVYVKIMLKARAAQQIPLTRELRERLKVSFDAHGVVVPHLARPMSYNPDGTPITPGSPPAAGAAPPR